MNKQEQFSSARMDAKTLVLFAYSLKGRAPGHPAPTWWDDTSEDDFYEVVDNHLSNPREPERQLIRRQLHQLGAQSVLDAGCGPATEYLSYQLNGSLKQAKYTGLDMSERMLDVARKRYSSIELVRGDVSALPFADESFDAVVIKHILEHLPDGYEQTLSEAIRVARKGVVIGFFHQPLPVIPDVHITDQNGVANNWYGKKKFEKFLTNLPLSDWSVSYCRGYSGQKNAVYTLTK